MQTDGAGQLCAAQHPGRAAAWKQAAASATIRIKCCTIQCWRSPMQKEKRRFQRD